MLREVVSSLLLAHTEAAERLPPGLVLMADPNWNSGFYYDKAPPHTGMKLARRTFLSA